MAEYGNGEEEHVGGIPKTEITHNVEKGGFFQNAGDVARFLRIFREDILCTLSKK